MLPVQGTRSESLRVKHVVDGSAPEHESRSNTRTYGLPTPPPPNPFERVCPRACRILFSISGNPSWTPLFPASPSLRLTCWTPPPSRSPRAVSQSPPVGAVNFICAAEALQLSGAGRAGERGLRARGGGHGLGCGQVPRDPVCSERPPSLGRKGPGQCPPTLAMS